MYRSKLRVNGRGIVLNENSINWNSENLQEVHFTFEENF